MGTVKNLWLFYSTDTSQKLYCREDRMDWDLALTRLNEAIDRAIDDYYSSGVVGYLRFHTHLMPLKRRFESGERTQQLYDQIMYLSRATSLADHGRILSAHSSRP